MIGAALAVGATAGVAAHAVATGVHQMRERKRQLPVDRAAAGGPDPRRERRTDHGRHQSRRRSRSPGSRGTSGSRRRPRTAGSPTPGPPRPSSAASRSSCRAATRATPGPSPSASAASAPWCTRWPPAARWRTRSTSRIPPNANLIRNLVHGMQFMQDHVIHFYHLHALDWVDVVSALKADPAGTAADRASRSRPGPTTRRPISREVQDRLKKFVAGGQLGIFTNGYWGHPGLQAAARGEPAGGGALPRGARLAARRHPAAHHLRRQEPAPQLPGGRHGLAPSTSTTPRTINAERLTDIQDMITPGAAVRGAGVLARPGGDRRLLQGVGGDRRRGAQLPGRAASSPRATSATSTSCTSRAASSWTRT